jgi:hypothetical protein
MRKNKSKETVISFIRAYVYICPTKIKLFVFVFRKQTTMAPFWKGDGNVDKIFCPKLLGPPIDASYQVSVHLAKRFQRRRI